MDEHDIELVWSGVFTGLDPVETDFAIRAYDTNDTCRTLSSFDVAFDVRSVLAEHRAAYLDAGALVANVGRHRVVLEP